MSAKRLAAKALLISIISLFAATTAFASWCGYRVTSAMNHGALKAAVAMCMDNRHLDLREQKKVPQKIIDQVLIRQISSHYSRNPKRKLPQAALRISSRIGWQTFWSADERRDIYQTIEMRLRPCPSAIQRYRELQALKRAKALK